MILLPASNGTDLYLEAAFFKGFCVPCKAESLHLDLTLAASMYFIFWTANVSPINSSIVLNLTSDFPASFAKSYNNSSLKSRSTKSLS